MLSGAETARGHRGRSGDASEIIVFDEPTAMLDPEGRDEVLAAIRDLNSKGTIVLITHYMEESLLADRVVVMTGGQITATAHRAIYSPTKRY